MERVEIPTGFDEMEYETKITVVNPNIPTFFSLFYPPQIHPAITLTKYG